MNASIEYSPKLQHNVRVVGPRQIAPHKAIYVVAYGMPGYLPTTVSAFTSKRAARSYAAELAREERECGNKVIGSAVYGYSVEVSEYTQYYIEVSEYTAAELNIQTVRDLEDFS